MGDLGTRLVRLLEWLGLTNPRLVAAPVVVRRNAELGNTERLISQDRVLVQPRGRARDRRWSGFSSFLCLFALISIGCGNSNEPVLGTATEHFLAAQDAIAKGDKETALKELDASLSASPDPWAYFQRAQVLAEMKQVDKALADCAAGLSLDKDHVQLKWLQGELKKPAEQRFQGKNAKPPVTK